jgi:pre-rRNA-processing protein TSR1
MRAAGLPEVICCVQGLSLLAGKRLLDARRYIQQVVDEELYVGAKIVDVSSFSLLGRTLSTISGDDLSWRSIRSFLVSETTNIISDEGENGLTLRVTGYLRGRPMNLHSLMYITGTGACCVQSIRAVEEVFPGRKTLLPALGMQDQVLHVDPSR